MHLWTILSAVMDGNKKGIYNRTAQKVGVQKLVGQAFPLTTVTVFFFYFTNSVKMFATTK